MQIGNYSGNCAGHWYSLLLVECSVVLKVCGPQDKI